MRNSNNIVTFSWGLLLALPFLYVVRYFVIANFYEVPVFMYFAGALRYGIPIIFVLLYLFIIFLIRVQKNSIHNLASSKLLLSTLSYFVISITINILEKNNYPNYIYEHTGLFIWYLNSTSILVGILTLVVLVDNYKGIIFSSIRNEKNNFSTPLYLGSGAAVLLIVSALNTIISYAQIYKDYTRSEQETYGKELVFLQQSLDIVPSDGVLIHPSQSSEYGFISNQVMLRYYAFPRTIVSNGIISNEFFENRDYYIISSINNDYFNYSFCLKSELLRHDPLVLYKATCKQ